MKKLVIVYVVLIIAVILLAVFRLGGGLTSLLPFVGGNKTDATAKIGETTINLEVSKSTEELQKGLSGRDDLPEDQGMIFVFEEKAQHSFWMKEMRFPIDIIFIDDTTVKQVVENAAPSGQVPNLTIYTPDSPVNLVLEVNAGKAKELGIKEGTTIEFTGLE